MRKPSLSAAQIDFIASLLSEDPDAVHDPLADLAEPPKLAKAAPPKDPHGLEDPHQARQMRRKNDKAEREEVNKMQKKYNQGSAADRAAYKSTARSLISPKSPQPTLDKTDQKINAKRLSQINPDQPKVTEPRGLDR